MRRLLVASFILLSLPLLAFGSRSATAPCGSGSAPVDVAIAGAEPRYDFSLSVQGIQSLASTVAHQVRQGWALGLTQSEPLLEGRLETRVFAARDGFCASPGRVHLTVGFRDITTYVPHDLWGDSCGFHAILAHEDQHLQIDRETSSAFADRLAHEMEAFVEAHGSAFGATPDAAQAALQARFDAALMQFGQNYADMLASRQKAVDSQEAYSEMLTVCHGELRDLVERARTEATFAAAF